MSQKARGSWRPQATSVRLRSQFVQQSSWHSCNARALFSNIHNLLQCLHSSSAANHRVTEVEHLSESSSVHRLTLSPTSMQDAADVRHARECAQAEYYRQFSFRPAINERSRQLAQVLPPLALCQLL